METGGSKESPNLSMSCLQWVQGSARMTWKKRRKLACQKDLSGPVTRTKKIYFPDDLGLKLASLPSSTLWRTFGPEDHLHSYS